EDQPRPARLPFRPRRVIAQPLDLAPAPTVIAREEETGRLNAGVQPAAAWRETPHRFDRLLALGISEAFARMRPAPAAIARLPHRGVEPFIAAAGIDRAARRIGDDVIHRPAIAIGPAQLPVAARCIAFEDERAFARAEEDQRLGHSAVSSTPLSRN